MHQRYLTRCLLGISLLAGCAIAPRPEAQKNAEPRPPNVVIVFADDLGYGDLSSYGSKDFETPALDRLAAEGMRFTDFYAAQPVCSASRAALLTGCYPNRLGIHGALGPGAKVGLALEETTLAELLAPLGYATAIYGKWHLGSRAPFLPTRQGFDEYEGLLYSNDMWPKHPESPTAWPPLPWFVGETAVEIFDDHDDQEEITRRVTARAIDFIERQGDHPFFLYLPHPMPHVPLGVGPDFRGTSRYGMYGDVIAEIDDSVAQVRSALESTGVLDDTIFIFTSDNGPWLSYGDHAGTTGGLREGKGTTFEGGVRVPLVVRFPPRVAAGTTCSVPCMAIDLLPTIAAWTGAPLPPLPIDGKSLVAHLQGNPDAPAPHEVLGFWYHDRQLEAVRAGRWKLHFPHRYRAVKEGPPGNNGIPAKYDYGITIERALFDLENDPGETIDVSVQHPEEVARLERLADRLRVRLGDRLRKIDGTEVRAVGRLEGP